MSILVFVCNLNMGLTIFFSLFKLKSMIKEKELVKLKNSLEKREKELLEKIKKLETPVNYGHESEGNEDFSEEADEAEEMGANLGIAEVLKKELEDVREALERIEKGIYGECKKCKSEKCSCE